MYKNACFGGDAECSLFVCNQLQKQVNMLWNLGPASRGMLRFIGSRGNVGNDPIMVT